MNEEEKKCIEILKERKKELLPFTKSSFYSCDRKLYKERVEAIDTILNLIEKQRRVIKTRSKEIESLYKMMSIKDDEIEKLKEQLEEERDLNIQTLKTLKECVHKDQIKGIIEKHKKFLLNELSKYEDDDDRKTILFAITRLCFILSDIFKEE